MKTNATRVLENMDIDYELLNYSVDFDDLSATSTAQKLGIPADQVFKTLIVQSTAQGVAQGSFNGVALAVIPGSYSLDLKALARVSGQRKVNIVPLKQVQPLTGYIRGGVTALACKKPYPVFLDEWAGVYERIAVSAGARGRMLLLRSDDYIKATNAMVGAISRED
ncbi:MAG: aminoacyl-tRNA deacylase [Cyanobacteria bacterium P01_F01_bin.53]